MQNIREALIEELCAVGEIKCLGEDLFEDMGGHILHESHLDSYIENYLKHLAESERKELRARLCL